MNPLEVFTEQSTDFYRLLVALTIMQRSHEESDTKSHRLRSVQDGKRKPEGAPICGYFPRVIPDAVYELAQRGRLDRKTKPENGRKGSGGPKGRHLTNLFSKLAVCDYCGQPMQYQNKGVPPKGQSYLVCSKRGPKPWLRDDRPRWRYDQFETMFLAFVEQLDLASVVRSSEHSSKRSELAFQLDAAEGRIKLLQDELHRAFETSMKMAEFDSEFLAAKIRKGEQELAEARKVEQQLRHEIAILDQTALTYYRKPDQVAQLIERVRSSRGGDVYKLRAQIASRLQSLISELRLTVDPDTQRFEVIFRDGQGMTLFVDPRDPTKFVQKISGEAPTFELVKPDGELVKLPAEEEAEDGF